MVQHIATKSKRKSHYIAALCWCLVATRVFLRRNAEPESELDTSAIENLIAKVGLGDRSAFSSLYDATSAKLFGVALRVLNDRGDAEDVLQEVFVKVWSNADRYMVNGLSPMTWLITIARNTAIDKLRSRGQPAESGAAMFEVQDTAPNPEAAAVASSEKARIEGCLEQLGDAQAGAVRGVYLDGATYQELADKNAVPINTMRTWLRRSLLKLKDCLSQ